MQYEALTAVTDDTAHGRVALVTRHGVHTLTVAPRRRAAELVGVIAARIGEDRIHPAAGADDARRMRKRLISAIVSACVLLGGYALILHAGADGGDATRPLLISHKASASTQKAWRSNAGLKWRCTFWPGPAASDDALSHLSCTRQGLARTDAKRRELSRWCIALHHRGR